MGLLDGNLTEDQSMALGLLGVGLTRGNFGGGAGQALQYLAGAQDRQQQRKMQELQMKNLESEIAARAATTEQKAKSLAELNALLNGGPQYQPGQMGSGTLGIMPNEQPFAPAPRGLSAATPEQIAMMKARGFDLVEPWKVAKQGFEQKPGSYRVDATTNRSEYIPDPTKGMNYVNGAVSMMPGFLDATSSQTLATERAKGQAGAEFSLEKVYDRAAGREVLRPRSQVLQAAQPQLSQPVAGTPDAPQGNFYADPGLEAAIAGVRDPVERQRIMSAFGRQMARTGGNLPPMPSGPMAAGRSAQEEAAAAAERVGAEADARAASERTAKAESKAVSANDLLGNIKEARNLLKSGPTASGLGSGVDAVGAFFGKSTKGADIAAKLDTISGWMTANVPRMEGPQSNYDVQNYKVMAALVGDKTQPVSRRLAALDSLEKIQTKYGHLNAQPTQREGGATGSWDSPSSGWSMQRIK